MIQDYLKHTDIINWRHPDIVGLSESIAKDSNSKTEYIERAFIFVRDQIKHSWDFRLNPVTCKASEVLEHKTGYCYAKSHILAALLRAHNIPAGFCYQRLSLNDNGAPYCLHGLNAVYLEKYGWYRIDARGNKEGINAQYTPPTEHLAFKPEGKLERDLPEIWPDPLPIVIKALTKHKTVEELFENLPDIEVII